MELTHKWGITFSDGFFPDYTHDFLVENQRSKYARIPEDFKWTDLTKDIRAILQRRLKYRFIDDLRLKVWTRLQKADQLRSIPLAYNGDFQQILRDTCKRTSPDQSIRMTSFAGGTYSFPSGFWPELRRIRETDLTKGIGVFDNEFALSEEGVRFFVEVDYRLKLNELFWEEQIPNFEIIYRDATILFGKLQDKFEGKLSGAVILTAPPKIKNRDTVCVGCHLIVNNLTVNCDLGRNLCDYLQESTGLDVDAAPYKSQYASLRPAFSRKVGECPECSVLGRYKRPDCKHCSGKLKVGSGSFYTPVKALNDLGELMDYSGESTYITPDPECQLLGQNQFRVCPPTAYESPGFSSGS